MGDPKRSKRLGLEPGSVNPTLSTSIIWANKATEAEARHSIAISLRRIADVLDEAMNGDRSIKVRSVPR